MGLNRKHEQRDSTLPAHRKELLSSIEKDLLHDENVVALFYGGSLGSGDTDVYSDIDLRVVVKPEKIKDYILNKTVRPQNWGDVLFVENINPLSIFTVAHYDCFIKVDTFYYKPEDIQPSSWLKNIKIMKDSDELMTCILEKSMSLYYEPKIDEIESWRAKFFAYLHEAYRRVMRKEYYYALQCIDKLRLSMAMGWYMDKGIQPNSFGDWAKYEGERSELENWQQALLRGWECGRDEMEISNVMKDIVSEFINLHRSLCKKVDLKEDRTWISKIVRKVFDE